MHNSEKKMIITALKSGSLEVTFKKVSTDEIRVMECTTSESILAGQGIEFKVKDQSSENDQIVAYALDKKAWRSFLASTVISWKVLS